MISGDIMKAFLESIDFDQTLIEHRHQINAGYLDCYKRLYQKYVEHGFSLAEFKASTVQFETRLLNNLEKTHKAQFIETDMKWIHLILDFKIFKIGSLRFQYFPMCYEEIQREGADWMNLSLSDKKIFYPGRPLINIHIETKTDLSPLAVSTSLEQARLVFKRLFPETSFEGFVIRSWLIYPPMVDLLPPNSNINQFAQRFEVITSNQASYQALKRVYDTEDLDIIRKKSQSTSLQRLLINHLDKLGVAFGFIPF